MVAPTALSPTARPLPPPPWRTKVRRVLRWLKRQARRRLPAHARRWSPREPLLRHDSATKSLTVTADTVGALRGLIADETQPAAVATLRLEVRRWAPPWPGWKGTTAPVPNLVRLETRLSGAQAGAELEIEVSQELPWTAAADAALAVLAPRRRGPALASAVGASGPVLFDAAAAHPLARRLDEPGRAGGLLRVCGNDGSEVWEVRRHARQALPVVSGRVGQALQEGQLEALAQFGSVVLGPPETISPVALAKALVLLAMTGLPIHGEPPAEAAALLAADLAELLRRPLPHRRDDALAWQLRSVAQRRAALRGHCPAFAAPGTAPPSVSALLVSRRPDQVTQAVAAMARQSYPTLEIVLGTHGFSPTAEQRRELECYGRPLRVIELPDSAPLGACLATVSQAASGCLVTKVDDDDLYGPEHLWDLVAAHEHSGAVVTGKGAEFVYLEAYGTTVQRYMGSEFYTDVVAGGTILLSRDDLRESGGWQPVPRSVDRVLLDQVLAQGGLVYRTHGFGFIYVRHDRGHTWAADVEYFTRDPKRQWPGLPAYPEFGTP